MVEFVLEHYIGSKKPGFPYQTGIQVAPNISRIAAVVFLGHDTHVMAPGFKSDDEHAVVEVAAGKRPDAAVDDKKQLHERAVSYAAQAASFSQRTTLILTMPGSLILSDIRVQRIFEKSSMLGLPPPNSGASLSSRSR